MTIFRVISTNILTFYWIPVISISSRVIVEDVVEDADVIYRHLWAHKSYVLIPEMSLLHMLHKLYLPSITVQSICVKKKKAKKKVKKLLPQVQPYIKGLSQRAEWWCVQHV